MFGERIGLVTVLVTANYRSQYRRSTFWSVRKTPQFSQRPHLPHFGWSGETLSLPGGAVLR
jgi:hypothetical protein